jgi:signal transduction histidine kinase
VKCLLVDDRKDNLLALSKLLAGNDVEAITAQSGAEALEILLAHDVALALLDVQMPEMDGFELAELMRGSERTRQVPIIFVTAGAHDQHRMFRGYDSGAVDFLFKPIEPRILQNKANVFFQLYRQKQQLAQELVDRTETLRLNEMFVAVLGHDLRNPLNAVLTGAQLLEHRSDDEHVRRAAAKMLSSAKRMNRLIEDMLDLTRARLAGGIPLKRERGDLGELVRRVIQEHQGAHLDRVIVVVCDGDVVGDWDGDRLAQMASNLIGNALQHGDAGSPVDVRVEGCDDAVTLTVENGGRIPAELLPHLFDPFRRGEIPMGSSQGLGLGLFIVQQIVEAHRGRITVESTDAGTTLFRVVVPRRMMEVVRL